MSIKRLPESDSPKATPRLPRKSGGRSNTDSLCRVRSFSSTHREGVALFQGVGRVNKRKKNMSKKTAKIKD